jgi:hypothetical protein
MSRLARLGTLLALPVKVIEEAAHAVAMWPWADRIQVWIDPERGTAGCDVALTDAPDWGLVLAAYAPMLAGAVLAATVAVVAITTGAGPSWWAEWMLVAAAVVWWAKLTLPSPEDRAVVDDD